MMRHLFVLVFTAGAVTLGMELSAARLLEPAFGNNQIVWASLIGLILLYLALGAWLGGKLADRYPTQRALHLLGITAALGVALIPLLSTPVLRMAARGLDYFAIGLLAGSLLAVLLLFSVPGILLGAISPWAVRLAVRDVTETGRTAGRIYAVATAGSIVGTFLPVLWLIPTYGTRWTFFILALWLLAVISLGSLGQRYRWLPLTALTGVLLLAWFSADAGAIRSPWDDGAAGEIIYEDESRYNYIAVRQWGSERHLKLNDGVGIHSVYHPDMLLSAGIWDYFLLAPLFQALPIEWKRVGAEEDAHYSPLDNALLIGLAAGTVSELLTDIYGPIPITGVELDPQIIQVGQTYFDMNQPNLTPVAADGRHWLAQQPATAQWDLIAVDAYRPPYIPFHLTTVEFFELVRDHLSADGVLAINVGRTAHNFALVEALTATLAPVFPTVHVIDEPGPEDDLSNSLVVATMQPTTLADMTANVAAMPAALPAEFHQFVQETAPQARRATYPPDAPIFTDDHAPVEQVVHGIIWDFVTGS